MRLADLDPHWVGAGGEGVYSRAPDGTLVPAPERHGVGLSFDCPCGKCGQRCYVDFENPIDGGAPMPDPRPRWNRSGDTFETLTLTPSILRNTGKGGCGWHGFVRSGEIVMAN